MKKLGLMLGGLLLMASASAFAADSMRIDLNGGERLLRECGGTIEAFTSSRGVFTGAEQINLVLRNVKSCSNFLLETTNQEYKISGPDGDRTGSFTLPVSRLNSGWNQVNLTVRSNSGAHYDHVSIWVNVGRGTPSPLPGGNGALCLLLAETYAKLEAGGIGLRASGRFDRISNAGNLVYEVQVYPIGNYEVVLAPLTCAKVNVSRK